MATSLAKATFHLRKLFFFSKNIDLIPMPFSNGNTWFTMRCRSPTSTLVSDRIQSQTTLYSTSTGDTFSFSTQLNTTNFRCITCDSGTACEQRSRCLNAIKQNMLNISSHLPEEDAREELLSYYDAHCAYEYYNQRYIRSKAKLSRGHLELAFFEKQAKSRKILSPGLLEDMEKARQKIAAGERECERAAAEVRDRARALFELGRF